MIVEELRVYIKPRVEAKRGKSCYAITCRGSVIAGVRCRVNAAAMEFGT
jgi:hypothetical protein